MWNELGSWAAISIRTRRVALDFAAAHRSALVPFYEKMVEIYVRP